ncbi:MAG: ribbon-helix-helix protein, CopG family [Spirochaetales bacterium]|jgi:predicted DNA-binding protein|nr:ribbon-helix-helix protein, CopG family [Spirochaetales bacterium]
MLTVRLPSDLETEINKLATIEKRTKSDIIKEALQEYIDSRQKGNSSYKLGRDLFGKVSSGEPSRSKTYKKRVKDKLSEKHTH